MNSAIRPALYTVGHSRHAIDDFVALLKFQRIARVVDVRGQPYSRHNPQYNREAFQRALESHGIEYQWQGTHLSGRPSAAHLYGHRGEVLWEKVRGETGFISALDRVAAVAARLRLALVCAEEDPGRCHRRFLLTPPLEDRGVEILHLRGDGAVESEAALRARVAGAQRELFE